MALVQRSYYVTRTTRALELAVEGPVTTARLAAELCVDSRTARRLLARLAADEMLRPLGGRTRRYVPGPRLLALACALSADVPSPPSSARLVDRVADGAIAFKRSVRDPAVRGRSATA